MKKKRLLAWLMTMVMAIGLLPATALAEETTGQTTKVENAANDAVKVTKQVGDANTDGTYPITMDAYVTGTVTTASPDPVKVVLVLDTSGSMDEYISIGEKTNLSGLDTKYGGELGMYELSDRVGAINPYPGMTYKDGKWMYQEWSVALGIPPYKFTGNLLEVGSKENYSTSTEIRIKKINALKIAAQNFVDAAVAMNPDNEIAVVSYASNATTKLDLTKVGNSENAAGATAIKDAIKGLSATGATRADLGMQEASKVLNGGAENTYVVFFTDGVPTSETTFEAGVANAAILSAKGMKDNKTTIYSVGVYEENAETNNVKGFMNGVSSNYPKATAYNNLGEGRDQGYYQRTNTPEGLNEIFGKIADKLVPSVTLGTTSVLKDVVSDYFVPAGITVDTDGKVTSGVTVKKFKASGTDTEPTWTDAGTVDATVKLTGKTLSVSGFDYSDDANMVVKKDGNWQGYKLQVVFNVAVDDSYTGWTAGTNYYDTNATEKGKTAGIYDKDGTLVAKSELTDSPNVPLTFWKVEYNANGGTNPPAGMMVQSGKDVSVAKPGSMTRTNYAFVGWNTQADGKGTTYLPDATLNVTESVTLYAQWKDSSWTPTDPGDAGNIPNENKVRVLYEVNPTDGGTVSPYTEWVKVLKDEDGNLLTSGTVTIPAAEATAASGYTFTNWTVTKDNKESGDANVTGQDATLDAQSVAVVGGTTYTFTANFDKDASRHDVTKTRLTTAPTTGVTWVTSDEKAPAFDNSSVPKIANGESVTLLYKVEVKNVKTAGSGTSWSYAIKDVGPNAAFVGYTAGKAVTSSNTTDGVKVEGTLAPDETIVLYFTSTFTQSDVTTKNDGDKVVKNAVRVDNDSNTPVTEETEVTTPNNDLSIKKERVTAAPTATTVTIPTGVNYDKDVKVDAGSTVTLLYKVTVTNAVPTTTYSMRAEGLSYTVTDAGANYVGYAADTGVSAPTNTDGTVTGTLTNGQSVDLYFTKTVTVNADTTVANTATLVKGTDTDNPTTTPEVKTDVSVNTYTYTLKYDANAGSDTVTNMPGTQTEADATALSKEFTVSSTVPTRDGYTFKGWAKTATATTADAGTTVTLTKDNATKTLYAVWQKDAPKAPTDVDVLLSVVCSSHDSENDCHKKVETLNATNYTIGTVTKGSDGVNTVTVTLNNPTSYYPAKHVKDTAKTDVTTLTFKYVDKEWTAVSNAFVLYVKAEPVADTSKIVGTKTRMHDGNFADTDIETYVNADAMQGVNLQVTPKIKAGDDISLLYKVTVENSVTSGNGKTLDYTVTDADAVYVGYTTKDTAPSYSRETGKVTGTLAAGKSVDLYFLKSFEDVTTTTLKNTAIVNEEEATAETRITIEDSISGEKVRLDERTDPEGTDVEWIDADALDNCDFTEKPVVDGTKGVTLMYKVTVTNDGKKAADYTVTDKNATYVGYESGEKAPTVDSDGKVTGTLKANSSIDLYFTKTFNATDVTGGKVYNTAVVNGNDVKDDGTKVTVDGVSVTKVLYKINGEKVDADAKVKDGDDVIYKITVTNNNPWEESNLKVIENPVSGFFGVGAWTNEEGNDLADTSTFAELIAGLFAPVAEEPADEPATEANAEAPATEANAEAPATEANAEAPATEANVEEANAEEPATEANAEEPATEANAEEPATEANTEEPTEEVETTGVAEQNPDEAASATAPYVDANGNVIIPSLGAGESVVLYYTVTVNVSDDDTQVTNTVIVEDSDGKELAKATTTTDVGEDAKAEAKIEKEIETVKVKRGEWAVYTITVTNKGDVNTLYVVEEPDDSVFDVNTGKFTAWNSGDEDVTVSFEDNVAIIENLEKGKSVTLTFKVKVLDDATVGATLENTATVYALMNDEQTPLNDVTNKDGYVYKPSNSNSSHHKKPSKPSKVDEVLNTEDHFQYVQGYPDGTVGPERNITRAEATVIFFRLLQDSVRAEYLTADNAFPDVNLNDWFNLGISTMENGGFVSGYEDGLFRPNGYITRAELATIISNFDDLEPADENKFADVEGHWAEKYINSAAEKGWLSGYEDGLFRPNQYITRAETMSMINRVLNRRVNADGLHEGAKQWKDNPENAWYYYAVLEATNYHEYERADVSDYENWTAIKPEKIWEN